jgi:hypothetical protein
MWMTLGRDLRGQCCVPAPLFGSSFREESFEIKSTYTLLLFFFLPLYKLSAAPTKLSASETSQSASATTFGGLLRPRY